MQLNSRVNPPHNSACHVVVRDGSEFILVKTAGKNWLVRAFVTRFLNKSSTKKSSSKSAEGLGSWCAAMNLKKLKVMPSGSDEVAAPSSGALTRAFMYVAR